MVEYFKFKILKKLKIKNKHVFILDMLIFFEQKIFIFNTLYVVINLKHNINY